MTDEELLAEWYKARGKAASMLPMLEEAGMLRALRSRQNEIENPKPLIYCERCNHPARGPHQSR